MSEHHHHHHQKKGSFTNIFARLFKTKEKGKGDSQTDVHQHNNNNNNKGEDRGDKVTKEDDKKHTTSTKPHSNNPPPQSQQDTNNTHQNNSHPPTNNNKPTTEPQEQPQPPRPQLPQPPQPQPQPQPQELVVKHEDPPIKLADTPPSVPHTKPDNVTQPTTTTPPATPRHNLSPAHSADDYPQHGGGLHHSGESTHGEVVTSNNTNTTTTSDTSDYVPLPFYEGSPKPAHNNTQPQKPRSSGPPEILPEEIEYDTSNDFLGQGSFGSVYKGRCRGQEVAVKIPRKQKLSLSELTSFRNEVKIMSKIYHPNVVLFLGACTQMGKMQIVTERCMTDLEKLLASKRPLSLYERMRMAKDAALGMNWLHGITRIVHNDLKSANLLVDNHMRVKVTDFGFSSIKEGDQFVDKAKKGTPLWMAPEVMMGQPYDDKADVYSFGIILWEIVTRDVPYKHHNDYNTFSRAVCHEHERPPLPQDIMPSIKYLITNCWDHDPKHRPSFNEIVFRISEVMVECMIDSEPGRQLWKKYFLLPKQELLEQVPWPDFAACIGQNLGLKSESDCVELLCNLKRLLISMPRDTMGLVSEVVTMERFDKVVKWFGRFFDPTVFQAVSKEINTLAVQSWFHWDISRDESTSRLSMHEEGTFLFRLSSTDPKTTPFTLSLTGNQHRRIKRVAEGYKLQGKPRVYANLLDLVANCEDYRLLKPCPKIDTSNPYAIENFG